MASNYRSPDRRVPTVGRGRSGTPRKWAETEDGISLEVLPNAFRAHLASRSLEAALYCDAHLARSGKGMINTVWKTLQRSAVEDAGVLDPGLLAYVMSRQRAFNTAVGGVKKSSGGLLTSEACHAMEDAVLRSALGPKSPLTECLVRIGYLSLKQDPEVRLDLVQRSRSSSTPSLFKKHPDAFLGLSLSPAMDKSVGSDSTFAAPRPEEKKKASSSKRDKKEKDEEEPKDVQSVEEDETHKEGGDGGGGRGGGGKRERGKTSHGKGHRAQSPARGSSPSPARSSRRSSKTPSTSSSSEEPSSYSTPQDTTRNYQYAEVVDRSPKPRGVNMRRLVSEWMEAICLYRANGEKSINPWTPEQTRAALLHIIRLTLLIYNHARECDRWIGEYRSVTGISAVAFLLVIVSVPRGDMASMMESSSSSSGGDGSIDLPIDPILSWLRPTGASTSSSSSSSSSPPSSPTMTSSPRRGVETKSDKSHSSSKSSKREKKDDVEEEEEEEDKSEEEKEEGDEGDKSEAEDESKSRARRDNEKSSSTSKQQREKEKDKKKKREKVEKEDTVTLTSSTSSSSSSSSSSDESKEEDKGKKKHVPVPPDVTSPMEKALSLLLLDQVYGTPKRTTPMAGMAVTTSKGETKTEYRKSGMDPLTNFSRPPRPEDYGSDSEEEETEESSETSAKKKKRGGKKADKQKEDDGEEETAEWDADEYEQNKKERSDETEDKEWAGPWEKKWKTGLRRVTQLLIRQRYCCLYDRRTMVGKNKEIKKRLERHPPRKSDTKAMRKLRTDHAIDVSEIDQEYPLCTVILMAIRAMTSNGPDAIVDEILREKRYSGHRDWTRMMQSRCGHWNPSVIQTRHWNPFTLATVAIPAGSKGRPGDLFSDEKKWAVEGVGFCLNEARARVGCLHSDAAHRRLNKESSKEAQAEIRKLASLRPSGDDCKKIVDTEIRRLKKLCEDEGYRTGYYPPPPVGMCVRSTRKFLPVAMDVIDSTILGRFFSTSEGGGSGSGSVTSGSGGGWSEDTTVWTSACRARMRAYVVDTSKRADDKSGGGVESEKKKTKSKTKADKDEKQGEGKEEKGGGGGGSGGESEDETETKQKRKRSSGGSAGGLAASDEKKLSIDGIREDLIYMDRLGPILLGRTHWATIQEDRQSVVTNNKARRAKKKEEAEEEGEEESSGKSSGKKEKEKEDSDTPRPQKKAGSDKGGGGKGSSGKGSGKGGSGKGSGKGGSTSTSASAASPRVDKKKTTSKSSTPEEGRMMTKSSGSLRGQKRSSSVDDESGGGGVDGSGGDGGEDDEKGSPRGSKTALSSSSSSSSSSSTLSPSPSHGVKRGKINPPTSTTTPSSEAWFRDMMERQMRMVEQQQALVSMLLARGDHNAASAAYLALPPGLLSSSPTPSSRSTTPVVPEKVGAGSAPPPPPLFATPPRMSSASSASSSSSSALSSLIAGVPMPGGESSSSSSMSSPKSATSGNKMKRFPPPLMTKTPPRPRARSRSPASGSTAYSSSVPVPVPVSRKPELVAGYYHSRGGGGGGGDPVGIKSSEEVLESEENHLTSHVSMGQETRRQLKAHLEQATSAMENGVHTDKHGGDGEELPLAAPAPLPSDPADQSEASQSY